MPTFDETLDQVRELLQKRGRLSYRALKRRFELDDEYLEDLKEELIKAERVAVDEEGTVLVWVGADTPPSNAAPPSQPAVSRGETPATVRSIPDADRRQLTVMFCDLVGSTPMSVQLDPEDYRDIMRAYQEMCGHVLARFTGHIARYEGDGILVYFGYPQAQEDAPAQAVRAGLHIIEALPSLNAHFQPRFPVLQERGLQVRIGMHTGLVVVGEMGSEQYRVDIAVGETPNLAARIQGQAGPNEVLISAATYKLVEGLFECEDQGSRELKGIATPQSMYRVRGESAAHSRFEVAVQKGLTPLVGREAELQFLHQLWTQAQTGSGQAVLLSGEPGIGKSRLVQEFRQHVAAEGATYLTFQCSAYHKNSPLYPIILHLERLIQVAPDDTPQTKLDKLQQTLGHYRFPQSVTFPLLAELLSLPHPEGIPPLTVSPQKQKELTQTTLVQWLLEEAKRSPVVCIWEDLHWADPSTLELLTLCLDHMPTARMFALLVFRPEFTPPWGPSSSFNQLTLSRLDRSHVENLVERVTGGRALPAEVVEQVAAKTDGVPLFVEELIKTIVESEVVRAVNGHYELTGPLSSVSIPSTLHDSLMARLDRLGATKEVAQLGATIGQEFSYELLQAVSLAEETSLQQSLHQLVEAGLVYQRGILPQAFYLFKHALIQDTAYESLLKSQRQALHTQISQVLETRFPGTTKTHPELVAHHYTEAGCSEQAIPYWQKAGRKANERSAYAEAVGHLTQGLTLLNALPNTPEHCQQELSLQLALGTALQATKGWGSREAERVYVRARKLCRELGETPQIFPALWGLAALHELHAEYQTGRELSEQLLQIAQRIQDPLLLVNAHHALGQMVYFLGEFSLAREHFEQGIAVYDSQEHTPQRSGFVQDPGMTCLSVIAWVLWFLGYPDQAWKRSQEAITLAQGLSHPFSLAYALTCAPLLSQLRREVRITQELAEKAINFSTEQRIPVFLELGTQLHAWALTQQEQEEGSRRLGRGSFTGRSIKAKMYRSYLLALLGETCGRKGQIEEGLAIVAEALDFADETGEHFYEAELFRLKGELTIQSRVKEQAAEVQQEAEQCFQKAIKIARRQQAKSLELRAATSLARLWQRQGKATAAQALLSEIYNWFAEGFDTKDLQEAKALLSELS